MAEKDESLNEYERIPSDVLIVKGFDRDNVIVTPYECDNCGLEFFMKCDEDVTPHPIHCPCCGVKFDLDNVDEDF